MKPTRFSTSPRGFKLVSLALCFALLAATILPLSTAGARESYAPTFPSGGLTPQPGWRGFPARMLGSFLTLLQGGLPSVPGANLPDLDDARSVQSSDPVAPAAIVSDQACTDCTPCPTCGPGTTNHAPGVDAGGPYYGTAGTAIVVNGLGSFDIDPGDGISVYAWTFGDGSGVFNGATPSHTYQSAGSYPISLTVTDSHNATAMASTTASITAAPPSLPPSDPTQGNAALFIAQSVPTTMIAGQSYPVSVTMRNTGTTTWSAAHLYRLGSENPLDNSLWGSSRILLPTTVAPGADVTFNFTVIAPYSGADEPPPAQFQWRMVQEFVQWFATATPGQTVTIVSNYQQPNPGGPQYGPFSNLFASRIAVDHRTGQPGEDLLSGNYNWGLGLVSLAGRAGMNLNLGLSYNSFAAWTKVVPPTGQAGRQPATSFTFDADRTLLSVGFRLGFPTIQGPFSNTQTGGSSYLMLMPSGGRVELRRVGATNIYEAADSSYLQLVDGGNGSLLVRTTDGTQLAYWSINSEYRCTEVKDRNGNYLTIKYDPINGTANLGRMTSIVDTLGRTLNFNYDQNYRLQSITQLRNGQTHVWASFGYAALPIVTNFTSSSGPAPVVLGLPTNHIVSVLTQVGLDDGSRYNFDYNSWGQIYRIKHFAADGHQLSYTSYNLPLDASTAQSDSPHFTQRQDWAENWNNNNAVTTTFQSDANGAWNQVTAPDGTAYREYATRDYADWKRGLVTKTEIYSSDNASVPKKTTITAWTQDVTNVVYPLNPRPTATTISDAEGNRRRTTIEYTAFGLPSEVYEQGPYGTNDWQTLRRTHTDYNLSEAYVNRRIIGLVAGQYLFAPDANGYSIQTSMSKTTMEYDAGGEFLADQGNPLQHDSAFGLGLVLGRGNVTSMSRWDVNYETDISHSTVSSAGYNTTGSAIFSRDPLEHQTTISYADSFSSNGTNTTTPPGLTLAYPTMVTAYDPGAISSTAKYNYDLGAVTRQEGPPPAGHQQGAIQTTEYDSAGRVKRITNAVNGAYTRFVYPTGQTIVNKFATIQEGQGEAYSATVFDGAGRVRAVAEDFPNSTGRYSGQFTLFDPQGRAVQSTNPTEMTSAWVAAGDDVAGWHSSSQTYDWKGRPLVTTNTDGTTKEASYGGCGCAGGEVVTLTDEGTLVDIDPGPAVSTVTKKRQQKIYSDVLGRPLKTEVLNWDGAGPNGTGGSVYSAIVTTYNERNQVRLVRQFQGAAPNDTTDLSCPSGTCQQSTITYDGYGRLKTRHLPEEQIDPNNPASTDKTTWNYNDDDTIQNIADARGAVSSLNYNARHLITGISYALLPGVPTTGPSAVVPAAPVIYEYDAAGNRTSMTDSLGSVTYDYDQLSHLRSETRTFGSVGSYTFNYEFNLAGELTKVTDPFVGIHEYSYDSVGRLAGFTKHLSTWLFPFEINDIKYRAWGDFKSMTFTNQIHFAASHDSRMALSGVKLASNEFTNHFAFTVTNNPDGKIGQYRYNEVGAHDNYSYDSGGRLVGVTAPSWGFEQNYLYDVWNSLTSRSGRYFNSEQPPFTATYTNNRNDAWTHDASGRVLTAGEHHYIYDAAASVVSSSSPNTAQVYDGDGSSAKIVREGVAKYYLRSTVMSGQVVAEINQQGERLVTYYYANGHLIAQSQKDTQVPEAERFYWSFSDPVKGDRYSINECNRLVGQTRLDPLGNLAFDTYGGDTCEDEPPEPPPDNIYLDGFWDSHGRFSDPATGCVVDGIERPCDEAGRIVNLGIGVEMPPGVSTLTGTWNGERWVQTVFRATADGGLIGHLGDTPTDGRNGPRPTLRHHQRSGTGSPSPAGEGPVSSSTFSINLGTTLFNAAWTTTEPQNTVREMAKFDVAKLKECVKAYGFDPNSVEFTASQPGKGGMFLGYGPGDSRRTNGIGVVNDLSYNSRQIGHMALGPPDTGVTINGPGGRPDGRGYAEYSPYRNYTSSNLTNPIAIIATQIHELGHSLSMITGVRPETAPYSRIRPSGKPDAGTFLERCVFGGEVGDNGRLYR